MIMGEQSGLSEATSGDVIDDRPLESLVPSSSSSLNVLPSIEAASELRVEQPDLKRSLGVFDLTAIGVGGIVGAGIYVLSGAAAANYAGPAVVLSFVFSAVACSFSALCYNELASMIPFAGSAYSFTSATLGEFVGFFIGHDLMLEYMFGAATVAVGWSGYAVSLLRDMGVEVPAALASSPMRYNGETDAWEMTGGTINVPAILIVAAMTGLNIVGMQETAIFNRIVVTIKLSVLILFVVACLGSIDVSNWSPFIPPQGEEGFGHFGVGGIFRGSSVVFFSYIGFDSISTCASEAKNPQTTIPIATLASLGICTILYIAVGLVMTGVVSYKDLNVADPIAVVVDAAGGGLFWLRPIVKVGAVLGLTSVVMVMMLGQSRIFYAMSKDGLLPPFFSRIHPRFGTPWVATLVTGAVAATVSGFVPIDILGEMVSIGTLFAFVLVCGGVIRLRRSEPGLKRPFKTPLVPFVPIAGALTALVQMVVLPPATWLRLFIWMLIGLAIYYGYGKKHAKPYAERRAALLGLQVASTPAAASSTSATAVSTTATQLGGDFGSSTAADQAHTRATLPLAADASRATFVEERSNDSSSTSATSAVDGDVASSKSGTAAAQDW